jgi:predicted NUDIX family NTP pyrophosphohydrolase
MPKQTGGILLYRSNGGELEVLLTHPGGPYWENKDDGAWTIPKGIIEDGEKPVEAAAREFEEELGSPLPAGELRRLKPIRQAGGKLVHAWAVEGDFDPKKLRSNTFSMEWPPKSGEKQEFPEVDQAAWFTIDIARQRVLKSQSDLLDQLEDLLRSSS